ncbi:MAG: hypothetical protein SPD98_02940 [Tractidigestivibacter sp.]|uniref:hypothetical protein n=1 Tax=Tractidigestivibacter sp. TaxID=2847320 RepID=UPI002A809548|nr:hypothetical protein [Tractidigestivibacter sp.]MCI6273933.1 hypothetical protein [Coriobacteriaceae bacterium]MDY4534192.1 hypothetical protein [Tractidigestivibacter sp.]
MPSFKYLSVFSGIEAASVAFAPLGWEPDSMAVPVMRWIGERIREVDDACA